ncbi:hypothetical protein MTR67_036914 [Solanum verrucosum]|uniref:Uncharacterized protein n=1 Tax=Solanum verrucosum TaxID=315347 RepID=A0AAF0UDM4_SOLVR|nr:hypothetical protein MTR67_036914 [Solanum verrucosum]
MDYLIRKFSRILTISVDGSGIRSLQYSGQFLSCPVVSTYVHDLYVCMLAKESRFICKTKLIELGHFVRVKHHFCVLAFELKVDLHKLPQGLHMLTTLPYNSWEALLLELLLLLFH